MQFQKQAQTPETLKKKKPLEPKLWMFNLDVCSLALPAPNFPLGKFKAFKGCRFSTSAGAFWYSVNLEPTKYKSKVGGFLTHLGVLLPLNSFTKSTGCLCLKGFRAATWLTCSWKKMWMIQGAERTQWISSWAKCKPWIPHPMLWETLAHELWQWDKIGRQGKAGGILWESRGVQPRRINWVLLLSSLLLSHLGGTTALVKIKFGNWLQRQDGLGWEESWCEHTERNKTRKVWSFLALTPFWDSHWVNFLQGQFCHQSGLQPAGAVEMPWTAFQCTELKFILLEERILNQAGLCAGSSSLGIPPLTVSIGMSW